MMPQQVRWDSPSVFKHLTQLTLTRAIFRTRRLISRLRSPRRLLATLLAIGFFVTYLLNGIYVLSARDTADPGQLRFWLSGGMVIYVMYHLVRCVWTKQVADLQLTGAERNILGGAPIRRSSLAIYHINNVFLASLIKTFLLAVVLMFDVARIEFLAIGVFTALILLETFRLIIDRWSAGLSKSGAELMRIAATAIVVAVALQMLARLIASTPFGSPMPTYVSNGFRALGDTASCTVIQWLALPWYASSALVVSTGYSAMTCGLLLATLLTTPLAILGLVWIDQWAHHCRLAREQEAFSQKGFSRDSPVRAQGDRSLTETRSFTDRCFGWMPNEILALIARQSVSVRRHRASVLVSFLIPVFLCLSPLITGQSDQQWFFVVGGVALCTILLAPPALRIDFRRDLRRMLLLHSLPIKPLHLVLGQLVLPVAITLCFQWATLSIGAIFAEPGWAHFLMWVGLLNALAVFAFAMENALFLAYPHHEHSEGIAMLIRAKLTFLGKVAVIAMALGLLLAWAYFCKATFTGHWTPIAMLTGSVATAWAIALVALLATAWCWRRFDVAYDIPPQ